MLCPHGNSGNQSPAADWHHNDFGVRFFLDNFNADGGGPGHHIYVAERVDIDIIFLLMQLKGFFQKLLGIPAVNDDFCTVPFGGLYFFLVTPFR